MRSTQLRTLALRRFAALRQANPAFNFEAFAKRVGVKPDTIEKTWKSGGTAPGGDRLNQLWHYLAVLGTASPELDKLLAEQEAMDPPQIGAYLGRIWAFGLVTLEAATKLCGLAPGNSQGAITAMRGERNLGSPSVTLEELKDRYGEVLSVAIDKLRSELLSQADDEPTVASAVGRQAPAAVHQIGVVVPSPIGSDSHRHSHVAELAVELVRVGVGIRTALSDDWSPADRALLRELMGRSGPFDLIEDLKGLCSEAAHRRMRGDV